MKRALGFKGERFIYLPLSMLEEIDKNPICSDLYLYSLGYFRKALGHYINRPKGCGQYILLFCIDGVGKVRILDRWYTLSSNNFIILPQEVEHEYMADPVKPWTIYWLHFKGRKAKYLAEGFDVPHNIVSNDKSRNMDRLSLFEEMYTTLKKGFSWDNIYYVNSCLGYFLGSLFYLKQYQGAGTKTEYEGSIINRSVYYMNENINKQLTIEDIASFINYSPSYFYRKFVKEIGMSPLSYFSKLKMKKACKLLTETGFKVNQIAAILGYSDPLYFSRIFSKTIGCSPSQYKNGKSLTMIDKILDK